MLYEIINMGNALTFTQKIIIFLTFTCSFIVALSLHEFAHAFVAHKLGDNTAKLSGRMSLNPMAHIDYLGFLSFMFLGFGWAKPVPINPYNFKNIKRDTFLVSMSGIFVNFIMFFVFYPLCFILSTAPLNEFTSIFYYLCLFLYESNLVLMVFNLLPVYPLDGFNALSSQLKYNNKYVNFMYRYGPFILLALALIFSFTNVFEYLVYYVGYPVRAFWGLILR